MLALSFTFLAGRYHATPWDRHVNEGAVAWPPEPWRILRALIATWHHKTKQQSGHAESTFTALIGCMAADLPTYHLPPGSHSHTRHYMPQFKDGATKLVLDAFVAVDKERPLTIMWPQVQLDSDQAWLLDALLEAMGYLGRAESWVEARRLDQPIEPNCFPTEAAHYERASHGEPISLIASLGDRDYQTVRSNFLIDRKSIKTLGATLPETLLEALSVNTSDLLKKGWNQPPASRKVTYRRSFGALRPQRTLQTVTPKTFNTAQFLVMGKPLPKVEDSLRVGEIFRLAIMSQASHIFGHDSIPSVFSGHNRPKGACHSHGFFIPWDADGDGHIDRLVFHAPFGLDADQGQVIESLKSIFSRDGRKWRLVLEAVGGPAVSALFNPSKQWTSLTPYLHPWHLKKGFSVEDQIKRECEERGMPEPVSFKRLEHIEVGKHWSRPIHFRRFRNRRHLHQPDRQGSFWQLNFAEPIHGPLALGFACHYGLGLFTPILGS